MLSENSFSKQRWQPAIRGARPAGGILGSRTGILITLGFGLTLCLFGAVLGYGLRQVTQIHGLVHEIVGTNNAKELLIREMHNAARERLLNSFRMFNSDDPFARDELYQIIQARGTQYLAARERLLALPLSEEESRMLLELDQAGSTSAPLLRSAVDMLLNGQTEAARSLVTGEAIPAQDRLLAALNRLSEAQRHQAEWTVRETDIQHRRALELMSALGLVGIALGLVIAIVVTRRVLRSEADLFQQKERAEVTLRSIGDGVVTLDADNRVSYMNPSATQLIGIPDAHAQGEDLAQLASFFDAENGMLIRDPLARALAARDGNGKQSVLSLLSQENGALWIENYAARLRDAAGDTAGTVFVMRDVTDTINNERRLRELNATLESRVAKRTQELALANDELQGTIDTLKKTQKQLIQSEKMAALGGLVAGISHEVNTPIGIAVTSGSNVEEQVRELREAFADGKLTKSAMSNHLEHIAEGSQIMLANLRRAAELIRSFKQVAVDQSSDRCRQVQLRAYCDEIVTSLHPKLKQRAVSVVNDCAEDAVVYTQPGTLYQIVSNLVVNSLVHAFGEDDPGEIRIHAIRRNDRIELDYSDDGSGIPEEHLGRVFEPFFTTRRGRGGSGLGLNIVYNLVTTKLGGDITVANRPEGGAHFHITFPDLTKEQCDEHPG